MLINLIENKAENLAKTQLADFKAVNYELGKFAEEYDFFKNRYSKIDELKGQFNSRVYYVRGIAAHYHNDPEIEQENLQAVTSVTQTEKGENKAAYLSRIANAYYYLALIESNFGSYQSAIDYFIQVRENGGQLDFLAMIVNAECYMMMAKDNDYSTSLLKISEIKEALERSMLKTNRDC